MKRLGSAGAPSSRLTALASPVVASRTLSTGATRVKSARPVASAARSGLASYQPDKSSASAVTGADYAMTWMFTPPLPGTEAPEPPVQAPEPSSPGADTGKAAEEVCPCALLRNMTCVTITLSPVSGYDRRQRQPFPPAWHPTTLAAVTSQPSARPWLCVCVTCTRRQRTTSCSTHWRRAHSVSWRGKSWPHSRSWAGEVRNLDCFMYIPVLYMRNILTAFVSLCLCCYSWRQGRHRQTRVRYVGGVSRGLTGQHAERVPKVRALLTQCEEP